MPKVAHLRRAFDAAVDAVAAPALGRRHFIVFRDYPIAYGRVPKVANTSIKDALTRLLPEGEALRRKASHDRVWAHETCGRTRMVRTAAAAQLNGVFAFAFVRDPFERVASYYDNKVIGRPILPAIARRDGVRKGMGFGAFLERLAVMKDGDMDDHLAPQAEILVHRGRLVPSFVGRYERIEDDWAALQARLEAIGVPALGPLPTRNRRAPDGHPMVAYFADPAHVRMVRERYAQDFELFYPDAEPCRPA
ncbi:sulfotransferase family protein [Methylopila henanensis]|uniref:Sulfotransferase family protein n=1 Tax=Methylopila henanensis TaxID=873516 RepID=A0ABW4K068_9HYPH